MVTCAASSRFCSSVFASAPTLTDDLYVLTRSLRFVGVGVIDVEAVPFEVVNAVVAPVILVLVPVPVFPTAADPVVITGLVGTDNPDLVMPVMDVAVVVEFVVVIVLDVVVVVVGVGVVASMVDELGTAIAVSVDDAGLDNDSVCSGGVGVVLVVVVVLVTAVALGIVATVGRVDVTVAVLKLIVADIGVASAKRGCNACACCCCCCCGTRLC